jgi:hypothetical protein
MQWQLHTDNLVAEARRVRAGSERLRDRCIPRQESPHLTLVAPPCISTQINPFTRCPLPQCVHAACFLFAVPEPCWLAVLLGRARALVEETHRVQQCTCDASLRALQVRNKEVQKLKAEVGDVHAGVCRELQTLETAMHSVVRSEKSLEHPMQVAQSRQSHRTVRPAPECVFDAAEQSLEREISDLGRYTPRIPNHQPPGPPTPLTAPLSTLNVTQPAEP